MAFLGQSNKILINFNFSETSFYNNYFEELRRQNIKKLEEEILSFEKTTGLIPFSNFLFVNYNDIINIQTETKKDISINQDIENLQSSNYSFLNDIQSDKTKPTLTKKLSGENFSCKSQLLSLKTSRKSKPNKRSLKNNKFVFTHKFPNTFKIHETSESEV
jgi:hypothetical protein